MTPNATLSGVSVQALINQRTHTPILVMGRADTFDATPTTSWAGSVLGAEGLDPDAEHVYEGPVTVHPGGDVEAQRLRVFLVSTPGPGPQTCVCRPLETP